MNLQIADQQQMISSITNADRYAMLPTHEKPSLIAVLLTLTVAVDQKWHLTGHYRVMSPISFEKAKLAALVCR